jgi:hypothetical protein
VTNISPTTNVPIERGSPWELEPDLIAALDLPLNLQENKRNQFHPVLTGVHAWCAAQARALPVVLNPVTKVVRAD